MIPIIKRPSESELHLGAHVGVLRHIYALRHEFKGRYGCEDTTFASHINGAIGELCLAKHLNVFWNGRVGQIKEADVGKYHQVRATELAYGKLITHPEDKDHHPFVLVRVLLPDVHLVGWMWGHEAKQQQFWRPDVDRPAYFTMPTRDMTTLPTEAEIEAHLKEHEDCP